MRCIFCQIAAHEKEAKILYEDDHCIAFRDINPMAPVHVLVIPRKHIESMNGIDSEDEKVLGRLMTVAARVAKEKGISGTGYRTVINTSTDAGQMVFHLHLHVLGGRKMDWPPG